MALPIQPASNRKGIKRAVNQAVDAINLLSNIVGGDLILLKRTTSGLIVSLDVDGLRKRLGYSPPPFWGKIQTCSKTSGFAKVRKATGTIGALTLTSDTTQTTVYIGIESHIRVGDEVHCVSNGSGVTPAYTAYRPIKGITWTEPDAGDLASEQDDGGGQCTTCCGDTVAAE